MKKTVGIILYLNLCVFSSWAQANPLESVARSLSSSASFNEFIEKTISNKAEQNELKAFAKNNKLTKLPLSIFENGILTLKESHGIKTTVEINHLQAGELKVNGQFLKVEWHDTKATIIKKIQDLLQTKQSLWNILMPQAQANLVYLGATVIILVITEKAWTSLTASDCDSVVDHFRENLKRELKGQKGREIVAKKLICSVESAEVDYLENSFKGQQRQTKVIYSKKEGSQEGFLQAIKVDADKPENVTYKFMQGRENMTPILEGVDVNGIAITDPTALENHKKDFALYRNSTAPLVYGLGKKCYECDPLKIQKRLEHRGFFEGRGPLDKQAFPATR